MIDAHDELNLHKPIFKEKMLHNLWIQLFK